MFTGLVEVKGTLVRRMAHGRDARLVIRGDFGLAGVNHVGAYGHTPLQGLGREPLAIGESIAVDGVCLTVAAIQEPGSAGKPSVFEADVSTETLAKTTLGTLEVGATLNLERAVLVGGRMGGHWVSGHVDGIGVLQSRSPEGASVKMTFCVPDSLDRFIAPKGSICINGVSLTVNGVAEGTFDVMIIAHTQEKTSLDTLLVGAKVNIEVDLLARYVARLLETRTGGGASPGDDSAWLERLQRAGYL
ncbi:MAG: riboflavin synthase [Polyangiaceae bacterium]|nr:riboflavin synthase [Polyangiaceae bacterium]